MLAVYDGVPNNLRNQMLGQFSGNISRVMLVSVTHKELTIVLTTGNKARRDKLNIFYDQV